MAKRKVSMKIVILFLIIFGCNNPAEKSTPHPINPDPPEEEVSTVITVYSNVKGFDGFAIDHIGNFILAHGWTNSTVGKLTPSGNYTEIGNNLGGPVLIGISNDRDIYVTNFTGHTVTKIDQSGTATQIANSLDAPAAITFTANNELLIGNYGRNYRGDEIIKISSDGNKEVYIKNSQIIAPIDLVYDNAGILYIANQVGGAVLKYHNGNISFLAKSPNNSIGHMIYFKGDLYITSEAYVYKISLDGNVSVFAGSDKEVVVNGPLLEASFEKVNGIATDGRDIYVADKGSEQGKSTIKKLKIIE